MTNPSPILLLKAVALSVILNLRHRVLRAGKPIAAANFEGDDLSTTFHYAAFANAEATEPLCCVTYNESTWEGERAFQLRGMATDPKYRDQGIASRLLAFTEKDLYEKTKVRHFWCNARASAVEFYKKQGWVVISDEFMIDGVGLHRKMLLVLPV